MNAINKPNEVSMFKVGDKTVGLTSETDEILEVTQYSCKKKLNGDTAIFMCFKAKNRDDFCVVGLQVRHATKEEIAAGHRIDLEPLRDCDTSPNCKKFDERVN